MLSRVSLFAFTLFYAVNPNGDGNNPGDGLGAVVVLVHNAINFALIGAGGLAVIFIAVGGLRYTLSAGDPGRVKQAKETILYAIVGLIIASAAFAIFNFVIRIFG